MKSIAAALADEMHYPLPLGFIENRLLARGLDGEGEISAETLACAEFRGAVADCLFSLVEAPNLSESDISVSLADRNLILKKANSIYASIGEEEKSLSVPKVRIGWG